MMEKLYCGIMWMEKERRVINVMYSIVENFSILNFSVFPSSFRRAISLSFLALENIKKNYHRFVPKHGNVDSIRVCLLYTES